MEQFYKNRQTRTYTAGRKHRCLCEQVKFAVDVFDSMPRADYYSTLANDIFYISFIFPFASPDLTFSSPFISYHFPSRPPSLFPFPSS